jgi:putative membrane protein
MEEKSEGIPKGSLILRDRLAENRTVLANERTLLAYVRTSLAIFAAGLSFIHFFHYVVIVAVGWVLLPIGAYTLLSGFVSFRKMKRVMSEEEAREVSKRR